MIRERDGVLYLNRGDTGTLTISLYKDGAPYVMLNTDTLTLTVKTKTDAPSALLTKHTAAGSNSFTFYTEDTNSIPAGAYSCTIRLNDGRASNPVPTVVVWPQLYGAAACTETNLQNFLVGGAC